MGISDLFPLIKQECGYVIQKYHLSSFSGYSIAIDVSIFFYQFVRTAGPKQWLDLFIKFMCTLKRYGIKMVCIFDGPNPPPEKKQEQLRRREQTAKITDKKKNAEKLLAKLTKLLDKVGPTENVKLDSDFVDVLKTAIKKRGKLDPTNYSDPYDIKSSLHQLINRYELQTLPITEEHRLLAEEALTLLGIPHFRAEGEAEALCAYMCVRGKVDAVLTEDSDVLPYGTPIFLFNLDTNDHSVSVIVSKDLLAGLEMKLEEFRDLCILLECDYNKRVKGFPPDGRKRKKPAAIGMKGALAMIREYRNLDVASEFIFDPPTKEKPNGDLIYKRCRQLFSVPADIPYHVPYNGPIKEKELDAFLQKNKCRVTCAYVMNTWKPPELVNEEEILDEEQE